MSNTENTKRKYEYINPDDYTRKPPKIIYNPDGSIKSRVDYDRWYADHRRKYTPTETPEEKQARYKRYSREYWTNYCIMNDLDPETWEEVRKEVLAEKRRRKREARRYGRVGWYRKHW